jgi:dihydroorotase
MYDLILRNGRLLDPGSSLDRPGAVAITSGRIASLAPDPQDGAALDIDVGGAIICPGLIDLHVHVYDGGTSLGVAPAAAADHSGVTTLVDAGSAGPANFRGFREHIIERTDIRILAFINISFAGIFGFGRTFAVGEGIDPDLLQAGECLEAIAAHREFIAGIKVRVGPKSSGSLGIMPLDLALEVAAQAGLPVMVHVERAPPALEDVVARLRPGDILTHCSRPLPNAVAEESGDVLPACLAARDRGVLFDVGHGRGSFSFASFRRMRDAGFLPDIVSSDVHAFNHLDRGVDLMSTMSKLHALGVPLETVIGMATGKPAAALRRSDLGHIRVGDPADLSVIEIVQDVTTLADATGDTLRADSRIAARGVVRGGAWRAVNRR